MDVDIMGRILGMPFDLIGRMSDPPFWNSAILAAALSAGLVSIANLVLDRRRTGKEKTRRQLQVITQLKGRKMEIKDLYMTLMQTTLNQVFTNVIRTNFTPNRNDEARVLNQENFRLRQLGDNLIVEVSKSTGRLIETLSAVQYLFPNVIEIDKKINNIIQMQQSLVHEFERKLLNQFNEDIISEMGTLAQKGGVSGVTSEQINRLQNALVDGASDEIFNWIITNIIIPIEDIEKDSESEIVEETYRQKLGGHVAQLTQSISQFAHKPGDEEIKKRGWWRFWRRS